MEKISITKTEYVGVNKSNAIQFTAIYDDEMINKILSETPEFFERVNYENYNEFKKDNNTIETKTIIANNKRNDVIVKLNPKDKDGNNLLSKEYLVPVMNENTIKEIQNELNEFCQKQYGKSTTDKAKELKNKANKLTERE